MDRCSHYDSIYCCVCLVCGEVCRYKTGNRIMFSQSRKPVNSHLNRDVVVFVHTMAHRPLPFPKGHVMNLGKRGAWGWIHKSLTDLGSAL